MSAGRPTTYTEELATLVCDRVATHIYGLTKLCKMYDDMPDPSTIYLWRYKNKEFSERYLQAKQAQIDLTIESLDDIMDDSLSYYDDDKGNSRIDSPSASIAIAKANNRKWYATKLAPALYGDKANAGVQKPVVEDLIDEL